MGNPDHPNKKTAHNKTQNNAPGKKSDFELNNQKPDKTELISDSADFSDLHKLISQGIVLQDTLGIVTHANPAAEQILGISSDEMVGRPLFDPRWKLIHEDGSELSIDQFPFMLALSSSEPVSGLTIGIFQPQQKKYKWVLVNAVPEFLSGQKKPYQVITTFADFSYIKSIVDTFGKHETLLNLAMVASDLGIWKLTFDDPNFFMDETTRRHFGFNSSLISVSDVFFRLHPEDQERVRLETNAFLSQIQTDSTKSDFRVILPDETIKWLAINVVIKFIETGSGLIPLSAVGTSQDITNRKQVEDELLQANQKYHLISEYSNDVIWVMDVETEKFSFISPSVKKLRGYTVEEMMQQMLADVLTPESYIKIKNIMSNSIPDYGEGKPSTSFVLELDQIRKDGSIVATEVTSSLVYDDQGNLQIIGISRDITERKQVEAVLREERNLFQILMNNIP
ncbi:MAG TPA: PAS domain S-box protein, partial [Leptolinea sp.]